jgi:glucose/arabinose dehydrogenase
VGVSIGRDGSLYVSDDGLRSVWRITYTGKEKTTPVARLDH